MALAGEEEARKMAPGGVSSDREQTRPAKWIGGQMQHIVCDAEPVKFDTLRWCSLWNSGGSDFSNDFGDGRMTLKSTSRRVKR